MRILTVSDHYPPHYVGVYELDCAETMSRLVLRGHQVMVLTSDYVAPGVSAADPSDYVIQRVLKHRPKSRFNPQGRSWILSYFDAFAEGSTNRAVRKSIRRFKPDLINLWRLGDLSPNVLLACLSSGVPTAFSISDEWIPDLLETVWTWLSLWENRSPKSSGTSLKRHLLQLAARACFAGTARGRGDSERSVFQRIPSKHVSCEGNSRRQ